MALAGASDERENDVEACYPVLDLMFETLAKDFSKEESAKEPTDNAIQSSILHFHRLHAKAIIELVHATLSALATACAKKPGAEDLVPSLRYIATAFDLFWEPTAEVSTDVLEHYRVLRPEWVKNLQHLERSVRFASVVASRSLAEMLKSPGFAVLKCWPGMDADAFADLPGPEMEVFWSKADELAKCVVERRPPRQAVKPKVVLTFDLINYSYSCSDNGKGMDEAAVRSIFAAGESGHGKDREIGRGGKAFSSLGSLCTGQLSSYGVGTKASSACLCKPDRGKLERGLLRVRSIDLASGRGPRIVSAYQDFAAMKRMEAELERARLAHTDVSDHQPWRFSWERQRALEPAENDIFEDEQWGQRLTRIVVLQVDPAWYDGLAQKQEAREDLVSFFADIYFPLLRNGCVGVLATRPLQPVELSIEFITADGPEVYSLGHAHALPECALKPYPSLEIASLPTIAQLLARNEENVAREKEADEAQYDKLKALFGPELTLRMRVDLPTLPGAQASDKAEKEKALLIFFYLPLWAGEETCFGPKANGLIVVQNGCRLAKQPPLLWPWMRLPPNRRNVDRARREILSDGCYGRVCGLIFLPPSCDITKNKARLTDECSAVLLEKLDPLQVPTVLAADSGSVAELSLSPRRTRPKPNAAAGAGSGGAGVAAPSGDGGNPASLGRSRRQPAANGGAASASDAGGASGGAGPGGAHGAAGSGRTGGAAGSGGAPAAPAEDLTELTEGRKLSSIYLDVFLPRMRMRDADVLVSDTAECERIANTPDDWKLFELCYMRKNLSTRQAGGLWLLYKQPKANKTAPKTLGRALYFVAHDGRPDPGKSSCDEYSIAVERCSLDDKFGEVETVRFTQVEALKDFALTRADIEKHEAGERKKLPKALKLFGRNNRDEDIVLHSQQIENMPKWICVYAQLASSDHRWQERLPLRLELHRADGTSSGANGASLVGWVENAPQGERARNKGDRAGESGLHFFDARALLPAGGVLPLGRYTLRALVRPNVTRHLDRVGVQGAQASFHVVHGEICAAHIVHAKSESDESAGLLLGHAVLPDLYLVCTDEQDRIVTVGEPLQMCTFATAVADRRPSITLTPQNGELMQLMVPAEDLALPRALVRSAPELIKVVRLRGFGMQSGFKLPAIQKHAGLPGAPPEVVRPYRLSMHWELKNCGSVKRVDEESGGYLLLPGLPYELRLHPPAHGPLALGSRTPELTAYVVDQWGNTCIREADGTALSLACTVVGLGGAPATVDVCEEGARRGRFALPEMLVTGGFGTQAALRLELRSRTPRAKGSAQQEVCAEVSWAVSSRLLCFHLEGAPPAEAVDGVPTTRVQRPFGSSVEGIRVRVHQPPAAGSGALLGAWDSAFSVGAELPMAVSDSGERKELKLLVTHGEAAVGWTVSAPKAGPGGKRRTLRAQLGGAVALLHIDGCQGPPAGLQLTVAQPSDALVSSGQLLTLRAIVVDAAGEPHRQCAQAAEALDLAALRVRAVGTGGSEQVLALAEPWVPLPKPRGAQTHAGAACKVTLSAPGAYTLHLDGLERLALFADARADGALAPLPQAAVKVKAGAPTELRLCAAGHLAEEGALEVLNAHRFATLSATVHDAAGNECTDVSGLGACTLRVDGSDKVVFGPDAKGAACGPLSVQPSGRQQLKWSKLHLRPARGVALPVECSLYAEIALPGRATPLRSQLLPISLLPGQQPHALEVQQRRYAARVGGPAVCVSARVLQDDGEAVQKGKQSCKVFLELPSDVRAGGRKASAAQVALITVQAQHFEDGWWTVTVPAPATVGEQRWLVGAPALGAERVEVVVAVEEAEPIEELDMTQSQHAPPLQRVDSQETRSEEPQCPVDRPDSPAPEPPQPQPQPLGSPVNPPPLGSPLGNGTASAPDRELRVHPPPSSSQQPSQPMPCGSQPALALGSQQQVDDSQLTVYEDEPSQLSNPSLSASAQQVVVSQPSTGAGGSSSFVEQEAQRRAQEAARAELEEAQAALDAARDRVKCAQELLANLSQAQPGGLWMLTQVNNIISLEPPLHATPTQKTVVQSVNKRLREHDDVDRLTLSGGRAHKNPRMAAPRF